MVHTAFAARESLFSFEVFPPTKTSGLSAIESSFAELATLSPDYISVTLGAAGSEALRRNTLHVADLLQNIHHVPAVAHLPAINFDHDEVSDFLDQLEDHGITRVLALRGDQSPDRPAKTDFPYATDLVRFIRQRGGFSIGAACYPETHLEAESPSADLRYLKEKVDAGVDYLITQLFFDNARFFDFMEKAQHMGIHVPVQAGIIPLTNAKQIKHIAELTQVHFPAKLSQLLTRYADDADSLRAAGIDYAIEQIQALQQSGVAGIHLYTMNNPAVAKQIYEVTQPRATPL